jgi:sugar O-acyltransferase (sialic acid O-acetyltransferase NeuD family)
MPPLLIFGAGRHAKVVADAARLSGWDIIGFVDLTPSAETTFCGAPLLFASSDFSRLPAADCAVAIGTNATRLSIVKELLAAGRNLPPIIHPRAIVAASAHIGPGSQLIAASVLNPDARLGAGVVINTAATIDHDCEIADGVHVGPGSHLAGNVVVGEETLLGVGTIVRPDIHIGRHCIVGAGSVVVSNVPDSSRVCGVPARPMPNRPESSQH